MHQEHAIPWNKLASNFQFTRDNPHFTPRRTGLFPRNKSSQAQDLDYFRRALTKSITDFSATERKKYDKVYTPPKDGILFSDELKSRYYKSNWENYLNDDNQLLEYWIKSANAHSSEQPPRLRYSTSNADLAEAVKILIAENQIPPLLMLAQHPQVPLEALNNLSWGHHFGFSRVMESALQLYILVNLFAAMGILDDGTYLETREWSSFLSHQRLFDYPAQVLLHLSFFEKMEKDPDEHRPMIHKDYTVLKEYVKTCFALLYRYDLVLRECGVDPEWDRQITGLFGWEIGGGHVKTYYHGTDEDGRDWKVSFVKQT